MRRHIDYPPDHAFKPPPPPPPLPHHTHLNQGIHARAVAACVAQQHGGEAAAVAGRVHGVGGRDTGAQTGGGIIIIIIIITVGAQARASHAAALRVQGLGPQGRARVECKVASTVRAKASHPEDPSSIIRIMITISSLTKLPPLRISLVPLCAQNASFLSEFGEVLGGSVGAGANPSAYLQEMHHVASRAFQDPPRFLDQPQAAVLGRELVAYLDIEVVRMERGGARFGESRHPVLQVKHGCSISSTLYLASQMTFSLSIKAVHDHQLEHTDVGLPLTDHRRLPSDAGHVGQGACLRQQES
jgi:hypothetical protein